MLPSCGSPVIHDCGIGCVLRSLPAHLEGKSHSAKRALATAEPGHPQFITLLKDKKWPGEKVHLGVRFLDTSNADVKAKILSYANKWGAFGNVRYSESNSGEIRLARQNEGYWSYLGTDVLSIPGNQPTMNLQGFSMSTPDAEYDRVVTHEFGHTMGFPHEHSRSEILALLDVEKTVQWFYANYGWSRADTMAQVFEPLDPASVWASNPDVTSIMCYQFSGACTKSGAPVLGGLQIDALDGEFCGKWYPGTITPPPPVGLTLTASPSSGTAPLRVMFRASGELAGGSIDFGDSTTAPLVPEMPHTFAETGTFVAAASTPTESATATVSVGVAPPPPGPNDPPWDVTASGQVSGRVPVEVTGPLGRTLYGFADVSIPVTVKGEATPKRNAAAGSHRPPLGHAAILMICGLVRTHDTNAARRLASMAAAGDWTGFFDALAKFLTNPEVQAAIVAIITAIIQGVGGM